MFFTAHNLKSAWEGEVRMCLGENEMANVKRLVLSAETLAEVTQMQIFPYLAMWVTVVRGRSVQERFDRDHLCEPALQDHQDPISAQWDRLRFVLNDT